MRSVLILLLLWSQMGFAAEPKESVLVVVGTEKYRVLQKASNKKFTLEKSQGSKVVSVLGISASQQDLIDSDARKIIWSSEQKKGSLCKETGRIELKSSQEKFILCASDSKAIQMTRLLVTRLNQLLQRKTP